MSTARTRRLVPSLLALGALGAGAFGAEPTVTILSPSTGAAGSGSTVVFKVDWGADVGGWDVLNNGYVKTPVVTAVNDVSGLVAADTTLVVDSGSLIPNGSVLKIGSELLLVTAGGGTASLTVTRGYDSTTAAAIADDAVVTLATRVPGDFILYQTDSTIHKLTPVPAVSYNVDHATAVGADGVVVTGLTTSNVVDDQADKMPSARSTVFTVTMHASADRLYLQIPEASAFTLDGSATDSPTSGSVYKDPTLIYQKLGSAPVISYLEVSTPVATVADYDGYLGTTPTVTFEVNLDDNEAAATEIILANGAIADTTSTSITVDALTGGLSVNDVIQIDSEQMRVTTAAVATNTTILVERGYNGTTAATHLDNAKIFQTATPVNQSITNSMLWTAYVIDKSLATSLTQLNGSINNSVTTVTVDSTALMAVGDILWAENEALLVTAIASATSLTVARAHLETTAVGHADDVVLYKGTVVGSTTFTKKGTLANVASNTGGRQTVSVPLTVPLAQGQHSLYVKVVDASAQTDATITGTGYGNAVIWDTPTLTVNGAAMAPGTTTQINRSNDLVFTGSRFNNATDSRKSIVSLKIDGGLPAVTNFVSTTLGGTITSSATSLTVASATNVSVGTVLYIGTEQLTVTAVSGTTLTVTRGSNGTMAAAHTSGDVITGVSVDTASSLVSAHADVTNALNGAIDASQTSVILDSTTGFDVGSIMVVGTEKMLITAVNSSTTLTVTRGYDGSTAASALDNAVATISATNAAFRFNLSKLPAASKHVVTLTQTYDTDNDSAVDAGEPQIVQTYYLDTTTIADVTAPAVPSITSPMDGSTLAINKPAVTGLAEPGAKLKLVATPTDGTTVITLDYPVTADATTGAYAFAAADWTSALVAGKTYSIQLQAKDGANNESALSDSAFQVVVPSATVVPTITPSSSNVNLSGGTYYAKTGDIEFTVTLKDLAGSALGTLVADVAGLAKSSISDALNGAITATATSITMDSTAGLAVGSLLKVDSEFMTVTAVTSGTVVAVTRASVGSTAAIHADNAVVTGTTGPLTDFVTTTGNFITGVAVNANDIVVTVKPGAAATSVGLSLAAGMFTKSISSVAVDNLAATAPTVTRDIAIPTLTAKIQPEVGTSTTGIGTKVQVVLTANEAIQTTVTSTPVTLTATGTGLSGSLTYGSPVVTYDSTRKIVTVTYTISGVPTVTSGNLNINLTSIPAGFLKDYANNESAITAVTGQSRVYDNTGSTCVISSTATTIGKTAPIPFIFTFNESVINFTKDKILITNGVLVSLTGTGAIYTASVMPGEGPTAVKVEFVSGATVTDAVGKVSSSLSTGGSGVSWLSRTYDTTTPRVVSFTSSTPAPTSTDAKPTSKTSIPCSIVFSESLASTSALTSAAFTVEGGTISGLTGSGSAYTFNVDVTNPSTETEKKIRCVLQAGKVKDSADNTNSAVAVLVRNFDQKVPALSFSTPTLGGSTAAAATATAQYVIAVDGTSAFYSTGDVFLSKVDLTKLAISNGIISSVVVKNGSTVLTDDSLPVTSIEVNVTGVSRAPGNVVTLSVMSGAVKDRAGNSSAATSKDLVIPGAG